MDQESLWSTLSFAICELGRILTFLSLPSLDIGVATILAGNVQVHWEMESSHKTYQSTGGGCLQTLKTSQVLISLMGVAMVLVDHHHFILDPSSDLLLIIVQFQGYCQVTAPGLRP